MSEHLSFFEEHSSDMPQTEYDDIIAQPTWQDFCDDMKRVELDMSNYDPNNKASHTLAGKYADDLEKKFGEKYLLMQCAVTGMGYAFYGKRAEAADGKPFFINTSNATYYGIKVCYLNGKWQATLDFMCHDHTDEVPTGRYGIPPDPHHLLTLNIDTSNIEDTEQENDEDEDLDVVENLHEDFTSVQAFVYDKDFATTPPEGQRMLLGDIVDRVNGEVPREFRDRDVVIECAKYYTAYDDMHYASYDDPTPGFDLHDFLTDLSDTPPEEHRALKGVIVGFEYPELSMLPPDHPLSSGSLDLNDGSYCLVLRSEDEFERATHYVLPQTISEIY